MKSSDPPNREKPNSISAILEKFSNKTLEAFSNGAHPSGAPNSRIALEAFIEATQAIEEEIVKARIGELEWVLESFNFPNKNDAKVFRIAIKARIQELKLGGRGGESPAHNRELRGE